MKYEGALGCSECSGNGRYFTMHKDMDNVMQFTTCAECEGTGLHPMPLTEFYKSIFLLNLMQIEMTRG